MFGSLDSCHNKTAAIIIFGNNTIIKAFVAVSGIDKFGARYLIKTEIAQETSNTLNININ